MEKTVTQRRKSLVFLFSLFIHCMVLYLLFYDKADSSILNKFLPKKLQQKETFEWAELKARQSQMGAPVIFRNAQQVAQNMPNQQQTPQPMPPEQTSQEMAQPESPQKLNQPHRMPTIEKNTHKLIKNALFKEASLTTKQQAEKKHQEIFESLIKKRVVQPRMTAQVQQQVPMPAPQKKPTLAQLARGFLDNLKNEGNNSINQKGNPNKKATAEQLMHERYLEKIQHCIQTSFRMHRHKLTGVKPKQNIQMYLALQRSGDIQSVRIAHSSGVPAVDDFMVFAFKDAGPSFPPVPNYVRTNPYVVMYTIDFGIL